MRKPSAPATSMRSAVSERTWAISLFSMRSFEKGVPFFGGRGRRRLHVHQNVRHPRQIFFDGDTDARGDFVGLAHGHFGVDFEMQIYVILEASAAGETLFDSERARNSQ